VIQPPHTLEIDKQEDFKMRIKSLGLKVSLIVAMMVAAIIVIIVLIVSAQSTAVILDLTEKEAAAANVSFSKQMEGLKNEAATTAKIISYSNVVVDAIINTDVAALKTALMSYGENLDTVTVCDRSGIVLVRMQSDVKGDSVLSSVSFSTALDTGIGTTTLGKTADGDLIAQGSAAIRDGNGDIIGAVTCGHDLSNPRYVDEVKDYTGSEVTIFHGDTRYMTTIIDENGDRVIGTKASDMVIDVVINQRQGHGLQINLFGKEYYAYYSPLIVDNEVIGMLFNGVHIDGALADQKAMMSIVLTVGIICGIVCIAMVFMFNILAVSRPLKKIGIFAQKIKSGDIGVSSSSASTIDVRSSDEVGMMARELEQAYTQLRGYVGEIRDRMQGLANGDLTTESEYEFQGDFVLIKDSINDHIRNLNNTMTEINSSSNQVSAGAKHIADGAQSLAQGSTEQASSIEELSASIAEIAERTKANAAIADKTAKLSLTIKENAEKGSSQMDDMITAVNEIHAASKSISKIIKTIDDIAFQTNILALNAAVEAARAGQHGKGFAVVAEEVRNLASKSAEAAKDTGDKIQNSMNKAELGTRIAGENAESLKGIVVGINESSQLIAEIASASEQQSLGIAQINTGIDQVAQVIQQNSATAEEEAAASEEMSGQSDILQQLIAQFRLKDSGEMYQSLPSMENTPTKRIAPPKNDDFSLSDNSRSFGKY